jgi:hypothetical protein
MRIRGAIERKTSQVIGGWLVITPEDSAPATIEVLYQGKPLGRAIAYEARPDVREAGFGDGNCGFTFRVPPDLENVQPDELTLRLLGTELYLTGRRGIETIEPPAVMHGEGSVFILGPARSGTSAMFLALQKVLGLSGLGESHVPQIFQRIVYQFYEYAREFAQRDGVLAQRLQVPAFRNHLINFMRRFYFEQFGGAPFVDKTPGLEALTGAPFLKQAFPAAKIIVMERNGVETIESYRRKFNASFEDALKEWSNCARETVKLKQTMPDVLFLSQNELRADPEAVAAKLSRYLGRSERSADLTQFFRQSRENVTSTQEHWSRQMTIDSVGWTEAEKVAFSVAAV